MPTLPDDRVGTSCASELRSKRYNGIRAVHSEALKFGEAPSKKVSRASKPKRRCHALEVRDARLRSGLRMALTPSSPMTTASSIIPSVRFTRPLVVDTRARKDRLISWKMGNRSQCRMSYQMFIAKTFTKGMRWPALLQTAIRRRKHCCCCS